MKAIFTFLICSLVATGLKSQCSITSAPLNDCASFGDKIDAFTLNSIASTGSSGCSTNGYGSFISPVWNLVIGNSYAFSASVGGGTWSQGFAIWIDLNNDGIYASTEMVFSSSAAGTSHSGSILIPYTAVIANGMAMRLRCGYGNTWTGSDACGDYPQSGYGETEDYKVNISCPAGAPTLSVAATSTHICVGQTVALTATGASSFAWSGGITNGVNFSPTSTGNYTVIGSVAGCSSASASVVKTISVSTTPIAVGVSSSTNTVCAGSTATITAAGATGFTWSPQGTTGSVSIVAPTANTTYTVVGYNGSGCPGFNTISITANPVPTINAIATPSNLCAGHIATLSVTGAQTYSWVTFTSSQPVVTVSPQSSTSYNVLGFNSFGCSTLGTAVVVTQASPNTSASASKTLVCIGSTVNLTAGGANTYVWTNGPSTAGYQLSPTTSNVYTVTGTGSNGCTSDATVAVNVFQATISVSQNTSVCLGSAVALTAGSAVSYSWNTTPGSTQQIFVTPLVSTLYILDATVSANNSLCKASNSVNVTVNPNPTITATAVRKAICKGETTTLTVTGASTYLWNNNQTAPSFTVKGNSPQTISYSVTGTDANGCTGTSSTSLKIDACLSLSSENGSVLYNAFPNPNGGTFTIKASSEMTLILSNELGQVIKTISVNPENLYTAEISGLSSGIYFVTDSGNSTTRSKIIVTK